MKTSKIITAISVVAVIAPVIAMAAGIPTTPPPVGFTSLSGLYDKVGSLLWQIVALVALVLFVFAGIRFMTAQGDATAIKTARDFVMWGVVGIVVAAIAYVIVQVVGTFLA